MSFRSGLLALGLFLVPFTPRVAHAQETVQVHLEDPTTRLERETPRGWELACNGACRDAIPAGTYRLREVKRGSLEQIGDPFPLDGAHAANVSVKPNRLRPVLIGLGATGMITGGLAAIVGLVIRSPPHLGCFGREADEPCPEPETNHTGTAIAAIGGIAFVAGTILLIGGVRQPHVHVSERRNDSPVVSSWRVPEPSRVPASTGAMTFSLLSGRF